ncbi:uncharacterized protein LOC128660189 [Bombina bombina]|uniref:uncharacterized protein LOC128660189 n=1 Tax=Bombina bombina TaxID=8345 RepID=UPI00235AE917|nr:uncharacterized protein LOC128660189 [Bombina bombina]XP_053569848.1 uncharacterized protein LOC128660189 [Bombina bombina]
MVASDHLTNGDTTDPACHINSCLTDLIEWMNASCLKVNPDKTELVLVRGPRASKISHDHPTGLELGGSKLVSSAKVRNLGVLIDAGLSFKQQISSVIKSAYFHLKNIARIQHLIPQDDMPTLIHAFVSSRLDYCNALYLGLQKKELHHLQTVQNTAARLLTNQTRSCHITPVLHSLHWLPIKWRTYFKIGLLTFKALNNQGPQYLKELLTPYIPSRSLRSANTSLLSVPRIRTNSGSRAFGHAAPTFWNSLPCAIREAPSLQTFKKS